VKSFACIQKLVVQQMSEGWSREENRQSAQAVQNPHTDYLTFGLIIAWFWDANCLKPSSPPGAPSF
jgi:hypothetical protein